MPKNLPKLGALWRIAHQIHLSWKHLSIDAPPATRVVKFLRPKVILPWWIDTHRPQIYNQGYIGQTVWPWECRLTDIQTAPILWPRLLTREVTMRWMGPECGTVSDRIEWWNSATPLPELELCDQTEGHSTFCTAAVHKCGSWQTGVLADHMCWHK